MKSHLKIFNALEFTRSLLEVRGAHPERRRVLHLKTSREDGEASERKKHPEWLKISVRFECLEERFY